MTIGEQIKQRLDKEGVYRKAQRNPDAVDRQAIAAELVELHKRAFDSGELSDEELSRAAECIDLLHGCGAIRGFDECWPILTSAVVARIRAADLSGARSNWHGLTSLHRSLYTSAEVSQADTRLRVASMARDELQELARKYPLLVAPFVEDVALVS